MTDDRHQEIPQMTGYPTPPTYNEARAARRLVVMHQLDPQSVGADALLRAQDILRQRSAYLSRAHRNSPRYKGKGAKKVNAAKEPVQYCRDEVLRLVTLLHTYTHGDDAARALDATRALEAVAYAARPEEAFL
jgi:hypothetical protein